MAKTIKWEKDFDRVLTLAQAGKKMVLLDFFNPLLYTLPIHELKKGVKLGDTFG